jgi:Bacterial regulatory proteins, luxR family
MEEYLTIEAIAERLSISPKTVKNKMARGVFKLGVHYFRPPGLGPRFKWSAVVAWMEQPQEQPDDSNVIPMPLHYRARDFG